MRPHDIEPFWDNLPARIEQRRVTPVLGAELFRTVSPNRPALRRD